MNAIEQQLLRQACPDAGPLLCLRTRTKVDTGRWWRRSPLWLCVMPSELVLLAAGRRLHVERIALAQCRDSRYSPAAGELVLAPAEGLRFPQLAMAPSEALRVLDHLKPLNSHSTPETTSRC